MKRKECFINDHTCKPLHQETGKPKIKEAHILSESATMKLIHGETKGGLKVYQVSTAKEIGWKTASRYFCFCGDHDDVIFKPIEDGNAFDRKSRKQLFLHSFRSFAYTYHKKREYLDSFLSLFQNFGGFLGAGETDNYSIELKERYDAQMYPYERVKKALIDIHKTEEYDHMHYRVFTVKNRYPFASAGCLMAEIIDENRTSFVIYEGEVQLAQPAIMLTVFPDPYKDCTQIILGCLGSDKNAVEYLRKYDRIAPKEVGKIVTSLMLTSNKENTFLNPILVAYMQGTGALQLLENTVHSTRGFDLLNDKLKSAPLNLFDHQYSCKSREID